MCECHPPIEQCQTIDEKTKEKIIKKHEFVLAKHKTLQFL